jgi:hypothetical protein
VRHGDWIDNVRATLNGQKERAMQSKAYHLRAAISLAAALPLIAGPGLQPARAQTQPGCQPGYYYASDGYCYPQPQPSYAAPPPVYDPAPPAYQSGPDVAGVAIGVGLGLLVGALADNQGDHGGARRPAPHRGRDDRGHH